ncbi:MAG: class I SAM-dependent methyltransferase [Candidatus Aerophobus sp.]|nr:MAG: class I SAM-dependent methyltransferase [Candidatus Aerophobus sp.]
MNIKEIMKNNLVSQKLRQVYVELEGENFNGKHFQQNRRRYLKMLEFILPFSSTAKILDIGCGYCYLTKFLKHEGFEVFAVDFFYGDTPKIRCHESGIPFFQLNIEVDDLPFGEDVFDVIILGEVLEHFSYSPLIPLKKIRRALKNGGKLILTTPNALRLINLFKLLAGYNLYPDLKTYCQEPIFYKGKSFFYRHNRLYSVKELIQLISHAGFKILSFGFISEGNYRRDNLEKVLLKFLISPLLLAFPRFRDFLWVVAEK